MKIDEVRSKSDAELEFDLEKVAKELFELRLKSSNENLQNPSAIRTLRRQVARIRTVMHERQTGVRGQSPLN